MRSPSASRCEFLTAERAAFIAQHLARIPLTLFVGIAALAIAAVPSVGDWLQFDRAAIAAGEIWRLGTCHLTHWNAEHFLCDWLMFAVLGCLCELRNPRQMRWCAVTAVGIVTGLVWCFFLTVETYRGLSGIDTALFTLLGIELVRDARRNNNRILALVASCFLGGFAAKTAFEAVTAQTVFVDHQTAGFAPLVWDHVAAGAVGAMMAMAITFAPPGTSRRCPAATRPSSPRLGCSMRSTE